MLTSSPKYLFFLLLCFIPLFLYFRYHIPEPYYYIQALNHSKNATSFEHDGVLDEAAEGAPRITQVSMQFGDSFQLMNERGLKTHIANGEKWGYPTYYLRHDIIGKGELAEGVYDKLLYLQAIMVDEMTKPFGKRAHWFDSDTVLLNDEIPWSIFLPPSEGMFRDLNMLITKDWQGFNAGIFLIRVCEWSIKLLSDAIALPRLRPEIDLPFNEQTAVEWVFSQPENLKHRIYQPKHWFNAYDPYYESHGDVAMDGSLVVHFPGMGGDRPDAMGRWLDKLDHSPEALRIPLENTTYPSEIEAYWSRLRSAAEMLHRSNFYQEEVKKNHHDIFISENGRIANKIAEAERELHEVIQENAFDKELLQNAVLALHSAVRDAQKEVAGMVKMQEDEEKAREEARTKAEEEKQREASATQKANEQAEAKESEGQESQQARST
ncbi:MAG: hypothetical protein Q9217_001934, partial [Psora testacea]